VTASAAQAFLDEGNAHRAAGRLREAAESFRRAIAASPGDCVGHYNLGVVSAALGEARQAALSFRDAARRAHSSGLPKSYASAVQSVASLVAMNVRSGGAPLFPRKPGPLAVRGEPFSIIVCSIRPDLLEEMKRNFARALGPRGHEFIAIGDARSLSEGYNRGLALARHGLVAFTHDDVELLSPDAFDRLEQALAEHDIVGLAGSGLVRGPAVMWAGHPHLRGFVAMPVPADPAACNATLFSLECGTMGGMQALDGFFLAARREAALAVGFDSAAFDGFHFYDLDFSYRASLAGLRVAVTTDVVALHRSLGNFADAWKRYVPRFSAKFPALDGVRGSNEHFGATLASRADALRFYEELRGLAATSS